MAPNPLQLLPTPVTQLRINLIMKTYFAHRNHRFWGLDGPGSQKPLQKAGREAPRLLEWFQGLPEPSRPPKSVISWSRKVGFHKDLFARSWGWEPAVGLGGSQMGWGLVERGFAPAQYLGDFGFGF